MLDIFWYFLNVKLISFFALSSQIQQKCINWWNLNDIVFMGNNIKLLVGFMTIFKLDRAYNMSIIIFNQIPFSFSLNVLKVYVCNWWRHSGGGVVACFWWQIRRKMIIRYYYIVHSNLRKMKTRKSEVFWKLYTDRWFLQLS